MGPHHNLDCLQRLSVVFKKSLLLGKESHVISKSRDLVVVVDLPVVTRKEHLQSEANI